jgi:hypothetical protein
MPSSPLGSWKRFAFLFPPHGDVRVAAVAGEIGEVSA